MPPNYPQQSPAQSDQPNYDFILNPGQPPKKSLLPRGGSPLIRAAIFGAGLLVLLILFVVIKGIVVKGPDYSGFVTIAQDQQAILHFVNQVNASNNSSSLSTASQNLAATAQLSLSSGQTQIFSYLSGNGYKVNTKLLGLKINSQLDTELSNAQTAGTYDQTFQSLIKPELTDYQRDLSNAYNNSPGPKGRALLKSLYKQAGLMLSQLSTGD